MRLIAITGPMGSGKSTVAAYIASRGFDVYDCDRIFNTGVINSPDYVAEIERLFGAVKGGKVDKKALSAHLAAHPEDVIRLNAAAHPRVVAKLLELTRGKTSRLPKSRCPTRWTASNTNCGWSPRRRLSGKESRREGRQGRRGDRRDVRAARRRRASRRRGHRHRLFARRAAPPSRRRVEESEIDLTQCAATVALRVRLSYNISDMFYSITGKVVFYEEGRLAVATPGGVAYELLVSNATLAKLGRQGETVTVYCRLAVAQDDVRLFGFYSKEEKAMFENLTSVGGVGGKLALQILSSVDVSTLAIAIVGGDAATLSKVKGIGKKTAERIILELREQVSSSATAIAPTDIMPTSAVGTRPRRTRSPRSFRWASPRRKHTPPSQRQ